MEKEAKKKKIPEGNKKKLFQKVHFGKSDKLAS